MFLSFYICLHYSFHKYMKLDSHELGNVANVFQLAWQMASSEVGPLW